jgi:16S rRNA (guanine(966)-N(2))-methyltransferase RsmD
MRIISGSHRGRVIDPPRNLRARPTTDFAKENLFNVLGNMVDFEGLRVLDLFAGTGSIGYEFCSRGAAEVTAVEINAVHYNFIRQTAATFGFGALHAVKANVFLYLRSVTRPFDLVFSDAPYDLAGAEQVIPLVLEGSVLRPGGLLVFEHSKGLDFSTHPRFLQARNYGSVQFAIFGTPPL